MNNSRKLEMLDMVNSTVSIMTQVIVDNASDLARTRYIVQKLLVPFIVTLGVTGNILSIIVLTRRSMKSSTNCYLSALSAFDCLYLIFSFTLSFKHYDFTKDLPNYWHWFPTGRVLTDMAANVSVILTVTFTVERYIGVVHPMKGRQLCTPQRAKHIICGVAVMAVICTLPEFCELEVVEVIENNKTRLTLQYTEFATSYSYQIGFYWFLVTFFTILPLISLCFFNGLLISTVVKANKIRRQMTTASNRHLTERHNRDQHKITKMLIMVVLVFLVCQFPGAILLMYRTYLELAEVEMTKHRRNSILIAGNLTNLLLQINASINFILYSLISTKFRRVFCRTVCYRNIAQFAQSLRKPSRTELSPYSKSKSRDRGDTFYLQRWKNPMVRKANRECIHYSIGTDGLHVNAHAKHIILSPSFCSAIYAPDSDAS